LKNLWQGATGYLTRSRQRRIKKKATSVLAGVVALSTVCTLILPAAALEEDVYCGIEAHEHGQECYERVLVCGQEEGAKPQESEGEAPAQQQRTLICGLEERESAVHEHSAACYTQERVLSCGLEESADVHTHSESCTATEQRLICADESEEHEHGEECYELAVTYVCGMEEGTPLGHVHTEACYITEETLSCGLEEGAELPGHTHTDACYAAAEAADSESAEGSAEAEAGSAEGAQETGHTHTEECYSSVLRCEKEEHRHELICFSDPEADLESEEVWAQSVSGVKLSGKWNDDLVAVAESQLGCAESTRNYLVDEQGEIKGYSRYGAWYGNPYGDWCAMFVSFCLHYAGIPAESFPYGAACGSWSEALKAEECGLWREKDAYTPEKGDVIFFDADCDGEAEHMGIIAEATPGADGQIEQLLTIEGNYGDCVQYVSHSAGEESIAGYGALPENPETADEEKQGEEQTEAEAGKSAEDVTQMIEALPGREEIEERIAAFDEAGDEEGRDAYLAELRAQAGKIREAYDALTEEEQAKVTNLERLTELDWLRADSMEELRTVSVTGVDGAEATVESWTPETTNEVEKKLKNELVTVDQGYTIQSLEYYRISGLSGSVAKVTYSEGGLSAHDKERVFVYDLGAEGTALEKCEVTESEKKPDADMFSAFSFTLPAESDDSAHCYAFISASPATLEEMGIYLGVEQGDGTWVAYDAATEGEANVKATLKLPNNVSAPDGYKPFIRKINEGEGFYPKDDAVEAEAGANNGWQCYTIRWIKQDENGIHMIPLNEQEDGTKMTVQVRIEYLKDAAMLPGPAGARKLLIFNSEHDGSIAEQVADTVENVLVNDSSYTSFTFQAAHSGPYVFVSKTLEKGYIDGVAIGSIVDGSEPFDMTDTAGNDSGANNRIVRSYDTIQYNLAVTFGRRQQKVQEKEIKMYFELILNKSATAARFAFDKMLWLGENYGVEYLDADGNVVMVMDHKGGFYEPKSENGVILRDESGFALADTSKPVSFNSQLNGSTAGGDSYKVESGGIVMQRLSGWTKVKPEEGKDDVLSGTQTFPAAVEVRNADNGETFEPTFKLWLEGNEENYGPETAQGDVLIPAVPVEKNQVTADGDNAVTVSAGTNFNLQLKKNGDMSYKNWFDFSTGDVVAEPTRTELERLARLEENHGRANPAEFTENGAPLPDAKKAEYENYRYGRITCYGIALQLYNDTDNAPDTNRATKGIKGISLPVGEISFDLVFSSEVKSHETTDIEQYTPILWDYNENIPAYQSFSFTYADPGRGTLVTPSDGRGNGGRNLYWDGEIRSAYAKGAAPSNYKVYHNGCYYGGDWSLQGDIKTVASPKTVKGSGSGTTYHFTVSDYDFDFDKQHFPTQDAGNSGDVTGYGTYARCFSAGCVQVLSVFPRVQEVGEAEVFLNTTVRNLHLETRAGQELKAQAGDATQIQHEVNKEDNSKRDQIVLYAPGRLTKGSAFNGLTNEGKVPEATNQGFLGTDYWTTSYDCSTFAGDDIWIMSYGMLNSGSDYRVGSMNLLQLFDSRALRVREEPAVIQEYDASLDRPGKASFLFAMDPDYKEGYDTNQPGMLEYMNGVREEDLVYTRQMPDKDGYITVGNMKGKCIGVLMELRDCNLLGGKYQYMRIPVTVTGDDETLVSQTVATVNTFRVWSYDLGGITWENGRWNGSKNELDGYPTPENAIDDQDRYSGESANSRGNGTPYYVKTEYQDGLQVKGTHAGGTQAGNSLLLLSYKAHVHITIDDKPTDSGAYIYHQGNSEERVVNFRLTEIKAEAPERTEGKPQVTTLTIQTNLDVNNETGNDRLLVSDGSYSMMGFASADGSEGEKEIEISTDSNHPTALWFRDGNGKMHGIEVYAQTQPGNKAVSFVIKDAPVGIQLPDITFKANFGALANLENNDSFTTRVSISGEGDKRAYEEAKGNASNVTVGIVVQDGTNLSKSVEETLIELDGNISYTVTYTNRGTAEVGKVFFYDLLPSNGDIRGTHKNGQVLLRHFDMNANAPEGKAPPKATIYYSTVPYAELYRKVSALGVIKGDAGTQEVEEMLKDTNFFKPLGTINADKVDGQLVHDKGLPEGDALKELMDQVTGLYVVVEELKGNQSVDLMMTVKTEDNLAGDLYGNIGNSWIAGSQTNALKSNQVQTQVVSRSISGLVWYDKNLNGVRDAGEALLEGVTATLFKKVGDQYVQCTENVKGEKIPAVTTGADGVYAFRDLAHGDYIVAFSGDDLQKFTGATSYQARGKNDADTNDGEANTAKGPEGIDRDRYPYFIRFSANEPAIKLHSRPDMKAGKAHLVNGVEAYTNQDLGLVTGKFVLPETGGAGTALYTAAGLLMLCAAGLHLLRKAKRKEGKA